MSAEYPFAERSGSINIDEITAVTLRNRAAATAHQMMSNMNISLYGDRAEPPRLTAWQHFFKRAEIYRNRIADAWLVLTGRAEIDGGY